MLTTPGRSAGEISALRDRGCDSWHTFAVEIGEVCRSPGQHHEERQCRSGYLWSLSVLEGAVGGAEVEPGRVCLALDGEVLGYDKYEPEEVESIEAEAAEIALKRAFTDDMRNQMAEEGTALPDGSFPIATVADLKNAISAYGRASNKDAAKKHIMKRAKALSQEAMIPDNWVSGEKSAELPEDIKSSLIEFELLEEEFKNIDPSI